MLEVSQAGCRESRWELFPVRLPTNNGDSEVDKGRSSNYILHFIRHPRYNKLIRKTIDSLVISLNDCNLAL